MSELELGSEFEQKTRDDWLALVDKALRGADFERTLVAKTYDDIRIDPLYVPDAEPSPHSRLPPGNAPFTRGWHSEKTDPPWQIDQLHITRDPVATNKAILTDLEGGASSITLRLAAPGQSGLESGSDALAAALKDVRLDMMALSLDAGFNVASLPAMLTDLLKGRPDDPENFDISLNADPLGTLAVLGGLNVDIDSACRQIGDLSTARENGLPVNRIMRVDGAPYHNAGASEAQELACVLATILAYLRAQEDAGKPPEKTFPELTVCLAADTELFQTTAKFRAMRKLIWQIAESCGCPEAAPSVKLTARTSERMMTRRDPWVNMLRTTAACAAASLGGAETITVLPFTWAIGTPDGFAARMARNCQLILREETALGTVLDPMGGSAYVDYLTEEISQKAWLIFQDIEKEGGMFKSLQSGKVQNMIHETSRARENDIALGTQQLTGISSFPHLDEKPVTAAPHEIPPPLDEEAVTVEPLPLRRSSAPFEKLRDASDAYRVRTGHPPTVFLASLGALSDFSARARWAANFFSAGGMETTNGEEYQDHDTLIAAFTESGASLVCICSADAVYAEQAEEVAMRLKSSNAACIYLAGRAGEKRDTYRTAGIDKFIHAGVNMLETLTDAHDRMDIH